MSKLARAAGLARSLALYHGIPFRARRLARLYAPFLQPGALAFDIGAHAGNRVRAFRSLGARVVAVEPQRDFVRLLEALWGRDSQVVIVAAAVGAAPGEARLLVSERTPTVTTTFGRTGPGASAPTRRFAACRGRRAHASRSRRSMR